jgi:hypothetical protein
MRVRAFGLIVVIASLFTACGSSSSPSSSSRPNVDVDFQAAQACKEMETLLTHTAVGKAITGEDAASMQRTAGVLIRTPDGHTPTTADEFPKWLQLGTVQIALYTSIATGDSEQVATFTDQARALCVTIPESAQKAADYTPVPTTMPPSTTAS